jgi:xylan 1,4-beta-xylosidase
MMRGRRVRFSGPDTSALAVAGERQLAIMVWNYTDDDLPGEAVPVTLRVGHLPAGRAMLERFCIDDGHSNAYEAWKKMGSPAAVRGDDYRKLEAAGKLTMSAAPEPVHISKEGETVVDIVLPAHGVSLLVWKW